MTENVVPTNEKRSLRYDFTAVEIHDLSLQLATKTKELNALTEEKKTVVSQYSARLNEIKATTNKLSNQVSDGYEIREVDCAIEYHKPKQGMKTLTRSDNNKKIEEKMLAWEYNLFNQADEEVNDLLEEQRNELRGKRKKKK